MEMNSTENKAIDEAITTVMNQIVNEIVPKLHPKSIIVTGSFGRNEPAIIINGGKLKFLSDCEISIVPGSYFSKKKLEEVKLNLSKKLKLDITISKCISSKIYAFPVPQFISRRIWRHSIQRYDLKYGSKVIYGENCLYRFPDLNPQDIPLWEGIRLLFNRAAEALKCFSIKNGAERDKLYYGISKILIACQDALLLVINQYDSSYKIRNAIFQESFPKYFVKLNVELPEFLPLVKKATKYKLRPGTSIFKENTTELWFKTAEICDNIFRYVLKKDMNITFNCYSEFQDKYLRHQKVYDEYYNGLFSSSAYRNAIVFVRSYEHLSFFKVIKILKIPWEHIVYSVVPLIYFSLSRDRNVNEHLLNCARNTLMLFRDLERDHKGILEEWEYLKEVMFVLWHALA